MTTGHWNAPRGGLPPRQRLVLPDVPVSNDWSARRSLRGPVRVAAILAGVSVLLGAALLGANAEERGNPPYQFEQVQGPNP